MLLIKHCFLDAVIWLCGSLGRGFRQLDLPSNKEDIKRAEEVSAMELVYNLG